MRDWAGLVLARLSWLRYQRLAQTDNRQERLDALYAIVKKVADATEKDQALIGQAHLTYAEELAYQGNSVYAHISFGQAVEHLNAVAPMLAMRARSARSALEHERNLPSNSL